VTTVSQTIERVAGFRVAGVSAGLKASGAEDMTLIASDRPCSAAGVFTTNLMKAAPVLLDMDRLRENPDGMRAVVVNTRCANACTGETGLKNARKMAKLAAKAIDADENQVLVMSTGVIGTHLPMEKIAAGIDLAAAALGDDWAAAARGIMTTDTRPKSASVRIETPSGVITVAGIAKGSGMIAPNMATMLGVIVTDAVLSPEQAADALKDASDLSFNRIVVDGDMSTNDTVLLLANGASGIQAHPNHAVQFREAVRAVALSLAMDIVRDGEGATKFISLHVAGAENEADAKLIANTIATSALVKTAFYGGDANWGRIVAAAGRAGVPFDPDGVRLTMAKGTSPRQDALLLFEDGMPTAYDEATATGIVKASEVYVTLSVGSGPGSAIVYTCDLSHDYVSINGSYRS
jgi:glutamate N-acetyltransferase / amino-acid N-acetyltransferase